MPKPAMGSCKLSGRPARASFAGGGGAEPLSCDTGGAADPDAPGMAGTAGTDDAGAGAGVESAGVPWVDLTVRIWNVPVALVTHVPRESYQVRSSTMRKHMVTLHSHCGRRVHSAVTYAGMPRRERAPCIRA